MNRRIVSKHFFFQSAVDRKRLVAEMQQRFTTDVTDKEALNYLYERGLSRYDTIRVEGSQRGLARWWVTAEMER
jgi:hypothetical protein